LLAFAIQLVCRYGAVYASEVAAALDEAAEELVELMLEPQPPQWQRQRWGGAR
jgi:hypothetical protein